ncbi:hypothetical protein EDB83DRAFT_2322215 [Lactarius deliciosus]|nr:hypothetical protein EDB83DRAFT_2322215 [Lactarius deliciosus]
MATGLSGWGEPLFSPSIVQGPLPNAQESFQSAQEPPQAGPSGRITSIVPARRVQPGQLAGGYGTKLITESEAEDQQMRAPEMGNTQVAAATRKHPPRHHLVLCSDASALLTVKNIRNKTAQSSALLFHFSLTTLCTIHRNTSIVLVWTPTDHELEGQTVARHKATEACRCDPPGGVERVQSAAYQKDCARQKAFQEWAAVWEKRQGEIRAGQRAASFADKITLTKPPDGNNHPLWSAATEYHAFTGSYATRFRPADPPESLRCPCGEPLRSSSHALYQCQRYYFERHAYGVVRYGHTIPYNKLLSSHKKNALRFLTFLQETRALSRPETGPDAYVPPEPD